MKDTQELKLLKATEPQETKYCIPLWLRDIQIRHAISRIQARVKPFEGHRSEPVAVVCFGPSLRETWGRVKDFQFIITCSGAHKFLTERGIFPTWHIEVDPRAHKVQLIGEPNLSTEYWISSTCHKKVFDLLEGYNVKLWHVFDGTYEGSRVIPPGEWALTGGCGVGLRAFTCAAFSGFRDIHVFGMDGCEGPDGAKHAAEHPNEPPQSYRTEYPEGSNRWFRTTPGMLEAARTTLHEMEQIPSVKFTFYGDGLVQAMAKDRKPTDSHACSDIIAMQKPILITPELKDLNARLHQDNALYGAGGHKHVETVKKLIESTKAESVLDYGCGKSTLANELTRPIWEYDPAIPGKDELPRPADLVLCLDVLEHVEPDLLPHVLAHLSKLTRKVGYFVINTGPAKKTYADGRNAHLIQQGRLWWESKLKKFFSIGTINVAGPELHVVVGPKGAGMDSVGVVCEVEHDGTTVKFLSVNDTTKWRAGTLFTKEPTTIEWIDTFKPDEVFYDVGANVGGYAVWAARRRGVKVFAFEPQAANYAILCRNLQLNDIDGVAYCLALTNKRRFSAIWLSSVETGTGCHSFHESVGPNLQQRQATAQGCLGVTLDDIAEDIAPPDHIKIDVDGLEHLVIEGGLKTLANVKSLLVEVNAKLSVHQSMINSLTEIGFSFDPVQVEKATRKDGPFKGHAEYVFRKNVKAESVEATKPTVTSKPARKVPAITLPDFSKAIISSEPFPHFWIENIWTPESYQSMRTHMRESELVKYRPIAETRPVKGYPQRFTCETTDPFWKDLFSAMCDGRLKQQLCSLFKVPNTDSLHDECLLIRDHAGYSIGPHTDSTAKVITVLFYLPLDDSLVEAGTGIYTPKNEGFRCVGGPHHLASDFNELKRMPFKPNSAFVFLKTDNSFHGVETCTGTRDVLLYDIRRK